MLNNYIPLRSTIELSKVILSETKLPYMETLREQHHKAFPP
jgi:hypothetical protein